MRAREGGADGSHGGSAGREPKVLTTDESDAPIERELLLALLAGEGRERLTNFANRCLSATRLERGETHEREWAQDGEDVVSDVIAAILEGKARCEDTRGFRSWVFTLVGNRARDVARRRRQRPAGLLKDWSDFPDPGSGPLDAVAELEEEARVTERINRVCSPCEAEVLRLVVLDGLGPKQAACTLRRQYTTVRSQFAKGRTKLLRSGS